MTRELVTGFQVIRGEHAILYAVTEQKIVYECAQSWRSSNFGKRGHWIKVSAVPLGAEYIGTYPKDIMF